MPMVFEPPDVPSPRTIPFSAHNKKELSTWWSCHSTLLADASRFKPLTSAPHLVLFGDSITESWRGTSYGKPVPRTSGVPEVLRETLAQSWPSVMPLGIAADMTQHLLWRLQRGELSASMRADVQLRMALLIGTNNLGKGHTVEQTVRGIVACATELLNSTRGSLLINALLPRGDRRKRGKARGRGFLGDIAAVNGELMSGGARRALESTFPRRVHFIDCGAPFLAPGVALTDTASTWRRAESGVAAAPGPQDVVRRDLMPDRLHPNAAGHRLWAACLQPALQRMG